MYRSTNTPKRICFFAAGLLLCAAPALGQGQKLPVDLTLPPASVIGRPSTIGPGQATAIPFAQLAASLSQFGLLTNPLTLSEFPAIGASTVLGSVAGGAPIALSSTQVTAMINLATATLPGALPAWPNNTTTFFRGDGTYAALNLGAIGGFGAGVATALGNNIGSAGAPVTNGGALGTPSSGTATNLTGTAAGLTAGNVTTNANLTGPVTSVGNATTIGANQVTLGNLVQSTAGAQFLGVTGASLGNYAPFTLASLTPLTTPSATLDLVPCVDHVSGTIKSCTPNAISAAVGSTTINGNSGAIVGVDTNTLNAKTANYTIASTDCGSTIQAGAGSTGLFTITLPAVTGFSGVCTVNVKNGDTTNGKVLSGFPADTNSILWPLQSVTVKIINGVWATTHSPGRWRPSSAITFHVNSTTPGSDTNNDCLGTGAGACATGNGAMSLISNGLDNLNGITIQWDTNTTTAFTALPYVGPGKITLNGNGNNIAPTSSPAGTVFSIGNEASPVYGNWLIENFAVAIGGGGIYGIQCFASTQCTLGGGMSFSGFGSSAPFAGSVIAAAFGANLKCAAGFSVTANWNAIIEADDFGRIDCANQTITLVATPFFNTATVLAHGAGAIASIPGVTWSGAAFSTTKKYSANLLGLIDSGACNSIPGTVAGTPTAGTLGTDGAFCN